jgi:hypothetical protein
MGLLTSVVGVAAAWQLAAPSTRQAPPAGAPAVESQAVGATPTQVRVPLRWDASTDTTVAAYVVSWGDTPGAYTANTVVAGTATTVELELSARPEPYFVAVQARNAAGQLSGYSNEFGLDVSSGRAKPLRAAKAKPSSTRKAGAKPKLTKEQKAQARREKQERKKKAREAGAQKEP